MLKIIHNSKLSNFVDLYHNLTFVPPNLGKNSINQRIISIDESKSIEGLPASDVV